MRITLTEWARRNFDPPPTRQTLYNWREAGLINPAPKFIGRSYWVEEDAQVIGARTCAPKKKRKLEGKATRLVDRIG
ncbi:excisionase [Chitinilyticum litopenaei]|uniref:excisionase n=1 Tax=Chitinilyticum litopenaei TaxID=1121276 RepID=UPI0004029F31|nr:excisionase [Chitinilyticum litopenaei]